MDETKAKIIKALSDFKANPAKDTMLVIYELYNEIFYHNHLNYGIQKRGKYRDFAKRCGVGCDKPVISALRGLAGLGADRSKDVGRFTYAERMEICRACKHSTNLFGLTFCGKPFVGGKTKEGSLCGCEMDMKAWIKGEQCSLDVPKWI